MKRFLNAGDTKNLIQISGIEFKRQDCEFVVPRQQARGSCIILELYVRAEPGHNLALCGTSQLGQFHNLYNKMMQDSYFHTFFSASDIMEGHVHEIHDRKRAQRIHREESTRDYREQQPSKTKRDAVETSAYRAGERGQGAWHS